MGLIVPVFVLGLMASLSPSTIVVFILLLGTTRARVNAVGFLVGWALSLTVVFAASYLVGASNPVKRGGGHTGVQVLQVVAGLALIVVGTRLWRRRREARPSATGSSRRLPNLSRLNPWTAAAIGVLKQPWAITAAAALVVLDHHTGLVKVAIAFAVFTAVSTASVALIFLYYARQPGEAEAHLAALRVRVTQAGPAVFAVAAVLVGTLVAVDGVVSLVGG